MKRLLLAGVVLFCLAVSAHAGTITVTSTADGAAPGPAGSLRKAINDAAAGDTITFAAGVTGTIILTNGELDIAKNLTITGPGANVLTISGNHASEVFNIASATPAVVNISGLTLANGQNTSGFGGGAIYNNGVLTLTNSILSGNSSNAGGAIFNNGTLALTNSTLSGNTAVDGGAIANFGTLTLTYNTLSGNMATGSGSNFGGAIYSNGTLTLTYTTLSGNTAREGGAIFNNGTLRITGSTLSGNASDPAGGAISNAGTLALTNSTLSNNSTTSFGGAIYNRDAGTMTLTNSTLSGNMVTGAISADGGSAIDTGSGTGSSATLSSCTITNNSMPNAASGTHGAIWLHSGTLTLGDTIVAGNAPQDVQQNGGTITSNGFNLIGNGGNATGFAASDRTGVTTAQLKLSALANNGGPTFTHALLAGSIALDAGNTALTMDQRGGARRFDLPDVPNASGGDGSDIGAFEEQPASQISSAFIVTTTDDHDDGTCDTTDCSLREAINIANAHTGSDVIAFASGVTGTITLNTTLPGPSNVTIQGPGARLLAVSGNNENRIFSFTGGTNAISGLTLSHGIAPQEAATLARGGAILNAATLTVTDCAFSANSVQGGDSAISQGTGGAGMGAAIANLHILTLTNCTFSDNTATGGKGGATSGGSGGTGGAAQGAVFNNAGASLTMTNCTFSGNVATGGAGGATSGMQAGSVFQGGLGGDASGAMFNAGAMVVTSCTLSGNMGTGGTGGAATFPNFGGSPGAGNGGLTAGGGTTTVRDTISAGNTGSDSGGPDAFGAFTSGGFNVIGKRDNSTGFSANGDQTGTVAAPLNAKLGTLANNGGPTDTIALISGSPAINAGGSGAPANDQRYYGRNGTPDSGAFEFGGIKPFLTLALKPGLIAETAGSQAATGTVAHSGPLTNAVTVNLASSNPSRVSFPSSVVIPVGKSSITFPIAAHDNAIADGPEKITISAASAGYTPGKIALTITDNEARLGISVDKSALAENGGANAATGTVTRNTTTTYPLAVKIDNGDKHRLIVPLIVTIPAGAGSATFPIGVIDDSVAEGPLRVKLTARVRNYPTTSTTVTILDNEAKLSVTVSPATFSEGAGASAATVTVTRNTPTTEAVTLSLISSNTRAVTLPPHVILAAGARSVSFPLTAINNGTPNATQSVTLTATAAPYGYAPGSAVVMVTDDD